MTITFSHKKSNPSTFPRWQDLVVSKQARMPFMQSEIIEVQTAPVEHF
jgi:hypothetical protein